MCILRLYQLRSRSRWWRSQFGGREIEISPNATKSLDTTSWEGRGPGGGVGSGEGWLVEEESPQEEVSILLTGSHSPFFHLSAGSGLLCFYVSPQAP